jgi:HEPN domain-containing protein
MEAEQDPKPEVEKRGRGRPPGSKNRKREDGMTSGAGRLVPPSGSAMDDYRHPDYDAMFSRQFALIDWQQQALRNKMKAGLGAGGKMTDPKDTKELLDLSNALTRSVEGLKKFRDMAEELAKRMGPAELLEAAMKKLEGQDLATLNYAIKRLRAHRERLAPVGGVDRIQIGYEEKATDAIASLDS